MRILSLKSSEMSEIFGRWELNALRIRAGQIERGVCHHCMPGETPGHTVSVLHPSTDLTQERCSYWVQHYQIVCFCRPSVFACMITASVTMCKSGRCQLRRDVPCKKEEEEVSCAFSPWHKNKDCVCVLCFLGSFSSRRRLPKRPLTLSQLQVEDQSLSMTCVLLW